MCAFGIDELGKHLAEIFLLGRHAEENTLGAHAPAKSLDIGDSETQFDLSCWVSGWRQGAAREWFHLLRTSPLAKAAEKS